MSIINGVYLFPTFIHSIINNAASVYICCRLRHSQLAKPSRNSAEMYKTICKILNMHAYSRQERSTHVDIVGQDEGDGEKVVVVGEALLQLLQVARHGLFAADLQHAVEVVDFLRTQGHGRVRRQSPKPTFSDPPQIS